MTVPNPHPLYGPLERISRTEEHIVDLRELLVRVHREHQDSLVAYFNPQPPHELRLTIPDSMASPFRIGVLIGEICYNLRSALDYLVFELAKLDSGSPQDDTQFLIESTEDGFAKNVKRRLRGLNSAHIAAIEGLQPYRGCNWTKTLRDLSNPDKHREFVSIKGEFSTFGYIRFRDANFDRINALIRRTPHPIHGEMDVKVYLVEQILLSDGSPIIETLEVLKLKVAETLDAFKPEF